MKIKAEKKIEGIGGWLLFYVVSLCFGALFSLIIIYRSMMDFFFGIPFLSVALILFFVGALNALVLVLERSPKAVFANVYLLAYDLLLSVVFAFFGWLIAGYSGGFLFRAALSSLASLLWIAYWLKSKRVENTFLK